MRLVTAKEMQTIDRHAIEKVGIDSMVLMENAGIKSLLALEKALNGIKDKKITVVCGKGNNGGDGLVIARHLFNNRVPVNVFVVSSPEKLSVDARKNLHILEKSGFQPMYLETFAELQKLRVALEFSDVVIDALFGTGFSGKIEGLNADVITVINECRAFKVAIDVPSGLDATTGKVAEPTVSANLTITLGTPKLGLYLYPGLVAAGEIWVADLGIPQVSFDAVLPNCILLSRGIASTLLPPRSDNSHKGTFGHVLVLAGSAQFHGAGVLASYGALRSGTGLVTLGMPEHVADTLACEVLPDVILRCFRESEGGFDLNEVDIAELSGHYRSIVAGPGWGKGAGRQTSVRNLLKHWVGGLVLDADALNSIHSPEHLLGHQANLVITPHLGEMARLTGKTVPAISENLIETAIEVAVTYKVVVVLKSATTVIADSDGKALLSSQPNSVLARGGSGDLLSGVIGGLLAQGLSPFHAAAVGVALQAEAADLARRELGADAATISEVAGYFPKAFRILRGELAPLANEN
jgi:NAD(P)H-hydrate epimerase